MQEGEMSMKLLEPISVKGISFQNRIAIAPMCPFGVRAGEEESLGEEILEYYRKRIATKPGLLITQAFKVKEDKSILRGFGIFTPKQLTDLKKLADIAHENGTKIIVQLALSSWVYSSGQFLTYICNFPFSILSYSSTFHAFFFFLFHHLKKNTHQFKY